jgi:rare lipoprotein A
MSDDGIVRPCAAGGNFALRQAARRFGYAAVLAIGALTALDASGATRPNPETAETETAAVALYLGAPAATHQASSSFTNRFDCSQSSFIAEMLTAAAYDGPLSKSRAYTPAAEALTGAASTYNPHDPSDRDAGQAQTSSGEFYDANTWTAAIRTDLRWQFGGVRFGKNYRPTFALVESGDRRVVVRINDVGPLKPGRIIDFNVQTMRYFDPTMQAGLIRDVKVTPLIGEDLALGPVGTEQTVMAGDFAEPVLTPDFLRDLDDHAQLGPLLFLR